MTAAVTSATAPQPDARNAISLRRSSRGAVALVTAAVIGSATAAFAPVLYATGLLGLAAFAVVVALFIATIDAARERSAAVAATAAPEYEYAG